MFEKKYFSIFKKPLLIGFLVFLLSFIIIQAFIYQRVQLQLKEEQQRVHNRALKLKGDLNFAMGQSYLTTQTLSYIVENYGIPKNFDSISKLLLNNNAYVDALELVNGEGTITHIYPLAGNEILGFNIFKDSVAKKGALYSKEKNDHFTIGPIRLKQGGVGFVSRKPLYKENQFAGFAAAIIRLSTIVELVESASEDLTAFSYQLAKINEDQTEEVFYSSKNIALDNAVNVPITTQQGEWKLYVISTDPHSFAAFWPISMLGFVFSFICGAFIWFITRQPIKLNQMVQEKVLLLKENQHKYETLVEQASDGIIVSNKAGDILDINETGTAMFGYTKKEILEKNFNDLVSPEDLAKLPLRYHKITKEKPFVSERNMIRKDGSTFSGEISSKVLPDNTVQGIVRDVTERKNLEKIAQNNLKIFSKAFNNSTIGMTIRDENNLLVDANTCFLTLTGYSLEEIRGKSISELGLVNTKDLNRENTAAHSLTSADKIDKMEVDIFDKSGKTLHVLASVEPFEFEGRNLCLSTFIDRTETKKAHISLRQREKEYRQLTERISDAFVSFNREWKFKSINAKAAKIVGMKVEKMIGKNLWSTYPEFKDSDAYAVFTGAMETQEYTHFVQYHATHDSWIENHLYPSEDGLSIYFRDITKKKQAELEKQQLIALVENSPGFIGLATLEGKSIYVNKAGKQLVSIAPDDDLSQINILDYFPIEYRDIVASSHLPSVLENGIWTGEIAFRNFKTNEPIPLELSSFLIHDSANNPIAIGCIAFDLTEHKKAQNEILDLKSKMDTAIRIAKIGYWDWNLDTGIIDWSPRMYEIYDVTPGTLITADMVEKLVHPDDLDHHKNILEQLSPKNEGSSFTYKTINAAGKIKYVLVEMEVEEDENNKPIRYRGTVIDITKQKESDNKIIDLQAKMNAAIRIGKFGYWNWNMDCDIVEWSQEMYSIHHIEPNTPMTVDMVKNVIYEDDRSILENRLNVKMGEKTDSPSVYRILLKDKTFKYILAFSELIYDKNGKPIRYHGTAMDITNSVLAERALKESQEKFEKAFQTNLMGMLIIDSNRRVLEVNSTVLTLFHLNKNDLLGKTILESGAVVMNDYDDNKRAKLWSKFTEEGRLKNYEFKVSLANGQRITLLVSIEPLFYNHKENYLVTLIDDTKRKDAEDALALQNVQLKKTNSELDSFVYSASHELRAPLTSVLGLIDLSMSENIDQDLMINLQMMEKSIKRLDDFIRDIIEYSRNKHLQISKEPISFQQLIESAIDTFWYLENTKNIKINVSVKDEIPFVSDTKRISILLNNFISNAIKYHDLSKKHPMIWIDITTSKKEAVIVIKDNGLGMEEAQIERIFDMFYRISSQIMGTGIGLFIVKEIMTKLNGTINVTSSLGEGSTFTLKLPNESRTN
ncbi:PAS domain S-box-containing protein [Maribacter sedimenticola]|uniref:histidine kinase n=1 Tax=Maribacter sedimenticola TaxID=228956 RepID=A0ABY1SJ25_9FLAO|nr:PAS domain S-box protein [Maribacter sedimenticola]SNR60765.1 PAS domain S-box-containing protein [Maribacter sedimenticola]